MHKVCQIVHQIGHHLALGILTLHDREAERGALRKLVLLKRVKIVKRMVRNVQVEGDIMGVDEKSVHNLKADRGDSRFGTVEDTSISVFGKRVA